MSISERRPSIRELFSKTKWVAIAATAVLGLIAYLPDKEITKEEGVLLALALGVQMVLYPALAYVADRWH